MGQQLAWFLKMMQAAWISFLEDLKGGWRVETISPHTCSSRPKNLYKKDFKVVFNNKRNLNLPVTYFRDDNIPHNRSFSVKTSHCSEKSWFWHKSHCMILMFQYNPAVMRDKFEITISADIINRVDSVHLMTLSDFFCSVKNIKNRIQDACISFPKKNQKPEDHHSPSWLSSGPFKKKADVFLHFLYKVSLFLKWYFVL